MTHILTLETLVSKGACAEAQKKFAEIFLNGAPVAIETFVNVADQFDWECAAELLLTPRNQVRFTVLQDVALAASRAVCAAAYAAARAAHDAACANYDTRARVASFVASRAALNAVYDAASAAYDLFHDTSRGARANYDDARATAFATLYIDQESQTL